MEPEELYTSDNAISCKPNLGPRSGGGEYVITKSIPEAHSHQYDNTIYIILCFYIDTDLSKVVLAPYDKYRGEDFRARDSGKRGTV